MTKSSDPITTLARDLIARWVLTSSKITRTDLVNICRELEDNLKDQYQKGFEAGKNSKVETFLDPDVLTQDMVNKITLGLHSSYYKKSFEEHYGRYAPLKMEDYGERVKKIINLFLTELSK